MVGVVTLSYFVEEVPHNPLKITQRKSKQETK